MLGGGVAGLTAAVTLARRGYPVTLFESKAQLGGKLGSVEVDLGGGLKSWISHGFHAFFSHYYNLNAFLDSLSLRREFRSIDDYVILGRDGREAHFSGVEPSPVLNLLGLLRRGMFSLKDAIGAPGRDMYGIFLEYERDETFRKYDHLSYAEFSRLAAVPPRLKLAFNTFARAFFADETKLSLAELVKCFHFYYLSHDGGLVYDYPVEDYQEGLMVPIEEELERFGAFIKKNTPVKALTRSAEGFLVNGQAFGAVVLATDVVGARAVAELAEGLPHPHSEKLKKLRPGQRYAVWRIWLDRDMREGLPVFVITERRRVLDSVTAFHRFERETQKKMAELPGVKSVLELHCYSVPDALPSHELQAAFWSELLEFFPELANAKIQNEHVAVREDFTAFHVGLHAERPGVESGARGLYCAGDWVSLPFPAMLLEAACASGLIAANGILKEDGLRAERVVSVPPRGLMAGFPAPPGRRPLDSCH